MISLGKPSPLSLFFSRYRYKNRVISCCIHLGMFDVINVCKHCTVSKSSRKPPTRGALLWCGRQTVTARFTELGWTHLQSSIPQQQCVLMASSTRWKQKRNTKKEERKRKNRRNWRNKKIELWREVSRLVLRINRYARAPQCSFRILWGSIIVDKRWLSLYVCMQYGYARPENFGLDHSVVLGAKGEALLPQQSSLVWWCSLAAFPVFHYNPLWSCVKNGLPPLAPPSSPPVSMLALHYVSARNSFYLTFHPKLCLFPRFSEEDEEGRQEVKRKIEQR